MSYILLTIILVGLIVSISVKRREKKQLNEQLQERNASAIYTLKHASGLPIAESSDVLIYVSPDNLLMEATASKITLDYRKILSIDIVTSSEILNQAVSSVGGAIAGAILLGPLGAIVGGRAKNKKIKKDEKYLVATYSKGEDLAQISFFLHQTEDVIQAQNIIKAVKPLISSVVKEIAL